MRIWTSFAIGLALSFAMISSAWADCTSDEAEALNSKVTARGVTLDATSDGWTAEKDAKLEDIKDRLSTVSDQHSAAISADDQSALNKVCEDYRAILVKIDELAEQME